jgi:hypothetical protein
MKDVVDLAFESMGRWKKVLDMTAETRPHALKKRLLEMKSDPVDSKKFKKHIDTYMLKCNEELIRKMRMIKEVQGEDGNWDMDEYMRGMYNGMELLMSIYENRDPDYRDPVAIEDEEVEKIVRKEKAVKS